MITKTFDDLQIGQWFRIKGRKTEWQYHGYCALDEMHIAYSAYGRKEYFAGEEKIEILKP